MVEEATEKQIKFATTLGIPNPHEFSKQALRELIDKKVNAGTKDTPKPQKVAQNAPKHEFHLTPEQVRTNALNAALQYVKDFGNEKEDDLLKVADGFEAYINNGYWA